MILVLILFISFLFNYKHVVEGFKFDHNDLKCENLINKLVVIKSNPYYRIGDIFYDIKGRHYKEKDTKVILEKNEFNNTILKEYILKNKKKRDYKLLLNIIDKKVKDSNYIIPNKNTLVIHLRAGDTVVFPRHWARGFLKKDYEKIIKIYLKKYPNINKVVFVCCLQYGDYKERNRWMFNEEKNNLNKQKIKSLLKNLLISFPSLKFDIVSNNEIDKDIIYMVKSKYFIEDTGNISKLIKELRDQTTDSK